MLKLSIIIPVYNKEEYLSRCFDSIISQIDINGNQFEILVIDDGSKDKSHSIIEKYVNNYHTLFTYIRQENSGVSVARNNAIQKASGDFVLFLDADDELIEGSLQKVYDFLVQNDSIDMLVTRQTQHNGEMERLLPIQGLHENRSYTGVEAFQNHYVRLNAGGGICRTQFIKEHNIHFPVGVRNSEDTIFFGIVQVYATAIMYYDIPLYRIYALSGSASRVNNTTLALRHTDTINAVVNARMSLKCSDVQKGIFEFYAFQLLSNTMGKYIKSKELGFRDFYNNIDVNKILPLDTKYMCMMKDKAKLMNVSYKLYYFINWLKRNTVQR